MARRSRLALIEFHGQANAALRIGEDDEVDVED
jgi:hypothetical protein